MADGRKRPDPEQTAPLDAAGYTLIPLRPGDKRPSDDRWTTRPYNNAETVELARTANRNIGVRLTAADLVIDVDPRNMPDGRDTFVELCEATGLDPDAFPTVETGSGGLHVYMNKDPAARVVGELPDWPGVEFKTFGQQVVAPGSVHPDTGRHYEWEPLAADMDELGPEVVPDGLMAMIRETARCETKSAESGVYTPGQLAEMLAALDVEYFAGRHDEWLELMMSSHHATGGAGREEFLAWCAGDASYAGEVENMRGRWDSLKVGEGGLTYLTLHRILRDHGAAEAIVPLVDPADDFDDEVEQPKAQGGSPAPKGNPIDLLILEMNETYCGVLDGGQFNIFMVDNDPAFGRQVWTRLSREAFAAYLQDEKVPEVGKREHQFRSKAQVWLDHPKRLKFRGIVMDPQGLPINEGKLNLWQGWSVEPKRGDWSMMEELIRDVLCSGDSASEKYVRRWIAYMLQRPWETPETAIAFRGTEGTGKGTLGRALMRIAGPHGLTVSSHAQFAGRFNSHLRDCVFLFADEAVWPGDKEGEGIIKQLVTEPVISYEAKGRDIMQGRNMVHLMLASNEEWIVPAGRDARRFFVSDVSERRRGDHDFFRRLNRQMDQGGLAAMAHDLLSLDLSGWRPSTDIPQTGALGDQKLQSLDPPSKFWLELLAEGSLPRIVSSVDEDPTDWREEMIELDSEGKAQLVSAFDDFLVRRRIMSTRATHKALVNSGKSFGLVTMRPGGSERLWRVPPLPQMRSRFEQAIGASGVFDDA